MPNPLPIPVRLPPVVQALLDRTAARAQRADLVRAMAVAALAIDAAWLGLYVLDRYGETPSWARLALLEGALLVAFGAALRALWAMRRWQRPAACARRLMRSDPAAGHLLLSAVELTDAAMAPPSVRPVLAAALAQVAAACAGLDLRRAVPIAPGPGLASALAICSVALLPPLAGSPRTAVNALERLARPLEAIPRVTRVTFADLPPTRIVPVAEPSRLFVRVMARQGPLPTRLRWALGDGRRGQCPVPGDGVCRIILPAVDRPMDLAVSCGEARAWTRLTPGRRPELVGLDAVIDGNGTAAGNRVSLLPGSSRLDLPAGATLRLQGHADGPVADVRAWLASSRSLPVRRPASDRFAIDLGTVASDTEVSLAWQARNGLWGHGPLRVAVMAVPDQAPRLRWDPAPPPATAPLTAILTFHVVADDDRGLTRFAVQAGVPGGLSVRREAPVGTTPRQGDLDLSLCPADLGMAPGQCLRLEAQACDALPGREPTRLLAEVTLLAESTRSAVLVARARRLWQDLEQTAAAESRQADSERTAATTAGVPIARLEAVLDAGRRAAVADSARLCALGADLGGLVDMAQTIAGFDDEVTTAWAEAQQILDVVTRAAFPALLAALAPSQAEPALPAARLAAVWPRRADIVATLRALVAADSAFRRCAQRTAAMRLLEAARAEQAMVADLGNLPDAWAGQALAQLGPVAGGRLDGLARSQERVATETDAIARLLRDLADGGAPEAYGSVADALDRSGLAEDLRQAAARIRHNHRFFALSTAEEAAQALATWARDLMREATEGPGAAGNGQGAAAAGAGEVGRRLSRVLLAQEALRERTAVAATAAPEGTLRREMAALLATHQADLAAGLPELSRVCPGPLVRLIDRAAAAMGAAATSLRAAELDPAQADQAAASEWLRTCLQSVRSSTTAEPGGTNAATAGLGAVALGQTGATGPDETPLGPGRPTEPRGTAWTQPRARHQDAALRAATPAAVPAPYRTLWEHYRRRLEEGTP